MLLCSFMIIWFPGKMPKREKTKEKTTDAEKTLIPLISKNTLETEPLTKKQVNGEKHEQAEREEETKKSEVPNDDGIFFMIGRAGHATFSMKYSETQYHLSASGASFISGGTRVFAMVIGFMLSGYLMGKYKPKPRVILGWNVFLGILHVGSDIFHIFLRCDDNGLYGLDMNNGK
uniref:Uncharacterized protein n=1 Tax=Timema douglasi TaxID=61478 RepID=A0A7R8VXN3_TIMDO|nr:unnamed protein product [Timema douglasi]